MFLDPPGESLRVASTVSWYSTFSPDPDRLTIASVPFPVPCRARPGAGGKPCSRAAGPLACALRGIASRCESLRAFVCWSPTPGWGRLQSNLGLVYLPPVATISLFAARLSLDPSLFSSIPPSACALRGIASRCESLRAFVCWSPTPSGGRLQSNLGLVPPSCRHKKTLVL